MDKIFTAAQALELAMTAVAALERTMRAPSPERLSIYGALHLAAVTAAAASLDRATTESLLAAARGIANRTGEANHMDTAFGSVNVAIHAISASLKLGDPRTATETSEALDLAAMPVGLIGRRPQVNLDMARAYAMSRKDAAVPSAPAALGRPAHEPVRMPHRGPRRTAAAPLCRRWRPAPPGSPQACKPGEAAPVVAWHAAQSLAALLRVDVLPSLNAPTDRQQSHHSVCRRLQHVEDVPAVDRSRVQGMRMRLARRLPHGDRQRTLQRHHDDYFARTAGEPRPRPSAPECIHRVQRMPHRSVISPTEHRFWPISQFLVFPGHRLIFYRFTPSSVRHVRRSPGPAQSRRAGRAPLPQVSSLRSLPARGQLST
jgi:hypothetical protein